MHAECLSRCTERRCQASKEEKHVGTNGHRGMVRRNVKGAGKCLVMEMVSSSLCCHGACYAGHHLVVILCARSQGGCDC